MESSSILSCIQVYNNIGNHSIAIIKGGESYESLLSFKPVLDNINKVVTQGNISIKDKVYSLEFFLGGDYKVLTM